MASFPTWEDFMIPTLHVMSDSVRRYRQEIYEFVAERVELDASQLAQTNKSGQLAYQNRIGWGISFLTNIGALSRPVRGVYAISEPGQRILERFPNSATEKELDELAAEPSVGIRRYSSPNSSKSGENNSNNTVVAGDVNGDEPMADVYIREAAGWWPLS